MKTTNLRTGLLAYAFFGAVIISCIFPAVSHAYLTAKANHDHITIDFFYHGSTVSVRGVADKGTELVVKIASPDGHAAFKKKGKVGGLMWMNVGNLDLENTPNLYFLRSTRKCEDMLAAEDLKKYTLGYAALKDHIEMASITDSSEKTKWFDEFVKFKENSNLYSSTPGEILTTAAENGMQSYYVLCQWPYQAAPGTYTVTVYAVKDGKVVEQAEDHVLVEQVGVVKRLAGMAKDKAAAYGILSVLAALGAGFGVGIIFRKGGGAH